MKKAQQNDTVKVHYKGTLNSGETFDSSYDKEPLEFKIGEGKLIEDFEKAVVGLGVDETTNIKIESDNAYGPVRNDLVFDYPKQNLPDNINPAEGMQLVYKDQDDRENVVKIVEVGNENIKLDANHPLAGEDLNFEIKLVEVL